MQIPDLNGRDRPCLHGEAGADLNRQNMRMQWNPNVFQNCESCEAAEQFVGIVDIADAERSNSQVL